MRQMNHEEPVPVEHLEGAAADGTEAVESPVEAGEPLKHEEESTKVHFGKRILLDLPIASTIKRTCESAKKFVPEPIWPDPDKEPLPPPVTHSIVRPPQNRKERAAVTLFSVWTPKEFHGADDYHEADKLPEMVNTVTRWILQPKESKKIYVKFFSKNIGTYD